MYHSSHLPSIDHCAGYYESKCKIIRRCNDFMNVHDLRVEIKRLPMDGSALNLSNSTYCTVSQKRHMIDRMLMNRSFYETTYNKRSDPINMNSLYPLGKINESVMNHLEIMADDITDPEFSGIWFGIYSKTYMSKTELGDHPRAKLIAWALVELLTSNERCFKGLWLHPYLNNIASTSLLRVFIPRIILASFDVSLHGIDSRYKDKFFYVWVPDIDIFPRISLALLGNVDRIGLRRHYEHSPQNESKSKSKHVRVEKSHTDDGIDELKCYCQKTASWNDVDNLIMGCSEKMMCLNTDKWLEGIPEIEPNLKKCVKDIISLHCETIYIDENNENPYDETDNMSTKDLHTLLKKFYGNSWSSRLKQRNQARKRQKI